MERYVHLLGIAVEHGYYAGGLSRGLRFDPAEDTAALLARQPFVVRRSGHGLDVHGHVDALAPTTWLVQAIDPTFANVTEPLGQRPGELPLFDGAQAAAEDGGVLRMAASRIAASELALPSRGPMPAFVVRIPALRADAAPHRFVIRLQPRRVVWSYRLVGDWSSEPVQVVDLGREASFGTPEPQVMDDGRAALAIRSTEPIALRERAPQRLQLRTRGQSEKVLVKRLPVAGPGNFSRETIDGVPTLVSEIYVHR